ncbi:MAG TPA: type II toxin-antitoxin system VapC family toxin [Thermoanaerobaculia bacterium]
MIGVDTNVLVRYLTHDDPVQVRRVDAFLTETMEKNEQLYVDDTVLCEVVWVLRAMYRFEKLEIADALDEVLGTALFSFEDRALLRRAVDEYRTGKGDFADYVIGLRNSRAGCEHTVTFDRALKDRPSFVLL